MKKIVLTGAAGRLGSYLREPLLRLAQELVSSDIIESIGTLHPNETYVRAVNPTSDNTIMVPNVSGTIVTTGNLTNATGEALSTEGDSLAFAIVFGG